MRSRLSGGLLPAFGRRLTPYSRAYGYDRGTPVDRHYIADFLGRHAGLEAYGAGDLRGRVLEVGGDAYATEFGAWRPDAAERERAGSRVQCLDVLHATTDNPGATIVGDLQTGAGLEPATYDCVICTQTLNSIFDVRAAVATLHDILKPGGVVLVTVPGIAQAAVPDRDLWGDYWRFTSSSMRRLFEERFSPSEIKVAAYGNVFTAAALLYGLAAEEVGADRLANHDPAYEVLVALRAQREAA